jgi:hypothetical protein
VYRPQHPPRVLLRLVAHGKQVWLAEGGVVVKAQLGVGCHQLNIGLGQRVDLGGARGESEHLSHYNNDEEAKDGRLGAFTAGLPCSGKLCTCDGSVTYWGMQEELHACRRRGLPGKQVGSRCRLLLARDARHAMPECCKLCLRLACMPTYLLPQQPTADTPVPLVNLAFAHGLLVKGSKPTIVPCSI